MRAFHSRSRSKNIPFPLNVFPFNQTPIAAAAVYARSVWQPNVKQ